MAEAPAPSLEPAPLGFEDAEGLLALCRALDWPHTQADWRTILSSGLVYGLRRGDDGPGAAVDACAALFPYGPRCAALGMVMTAPDRQRRGLGRAVVSRCLAARPSDAVAVYLATTPQGRGLYDALGFRAVGALTKLMAQGPLAEGEQAAAWSVSDAIATADLVSVLRLDRAAFGAPRDGFLKHRLSQAERAAVARDADGRIVGYGLAVRQGPLLILGPIAAAADGAALALVRRLAADFAGPLRIDVPAARDGFCDALQALGFEVADRPPILALGADAPPAGGWPGYAAIAAQAFL
ncbi:MAG: GNAT family N-acetyltransferase [Alphaproteobacteria bacterium]|nr:GNAT family N-acetyltransferase [Alphaproteobacteria bacterium]